ncbi:MAG TPA: hypothetical protein ENH12_07600 [Proteobacteria bacterium]|nr:hypothetical protein [Pseudomonadota bacterium]
MTSHKRIIFFLILLALIPRLISLFTFDFIDSGGGSDSVTYIALARNLFTGHGYTEFGLPHTVHHPFYPIMIGLIWQLTGDLLLSAQLISCLAGILLVVPVYLMASSMFGRRTGIMAGLMIALFPIMVYGSTESFSESLYTLLLLSGLAAGWLSYISGRLYLPVFSGIFLGLSFLTHPLGVTFFPLVAGFNLLAGSWRLSALRRRFIRTLLIAFGFILVCLPFWIHLHSVTGNWQLSGSSHYQDFGLRYDQSRGVNESKVIFEHMEALFDPEVIPDVDPDHKPMGMAELIISHPDRFFGIIRFNLIDGYHEAVKTARYLSLPPGVLFILLATGIGVLIAFFLFAFIRNGQRAEIIYLALMFTPLSVFLIMQTEHRYFYPFIPLAVIGFAGVIESIDEFSRRKPRCRRIFLIGLWIFYLALAAGSAFVVYRKAIKIGVPYEYKIMGNWMKDNIPGIEKERVMMFRLGISYYAGCDWNVFYWGEFSGLKEYLKRRGIKYLEVDSYKLHMIHPDLRFLLTADPLPSDFSLVREIEYDGRKIRLLEFHPKM